MSQQKGKKSGADKVSVKPRFSGSGFEYENKILTALFLDCMSSTNKFQLDRGVAQEIVGNFDDITLCINYEDNKKFTILIQTKHFTSVKKQTINKRTLLAEGDGDLTLVKYFHSFLNTIYKSKNLSDVKLIVLLTNVKTDNTVDKFMEKVNDYNKYCFPISKYQGSFYIFPQQAEGQYVKQLKDLTVLYHYKKVAKIIVDGLLKGELDFSQLHIFDDENMKLLNHTFEFTFINNTCNIARIKPDFLEPESSANDGPYREELITEMKSKSKNFYETYKKNLKESIKQPNDNTLEFGLGQLEKLLEKKIIVVEENTCKKLLNQNMSYINIEISDEHVKEFQKLFLLAVEQPNVDAMDAVIKNSLKNRPQFQGLNVDIVSEYLVSKIDKFVKTRSLNEKNGDNFLKYVALLNKSSQYIMSTNPLQIVFDNKYQTELWNRIAIRKENEHINLVISESDPNFLILKLYQTLQTCIKDGKNEILCLESRDLNDIIEILAIDNSDVDGFIVNCTSYVNVELYDQLLEIKHLRKKGKIIILLSNKNQKLIDYCKKYPGDFVINDLKEDILLINQLTPDSKLKVYGKKITCHGELCSVSDILDNTDTNDVITDAMCYELLLNKDIVIGTAHDAMSDVVFSTTHQDISTELFVDLVLNDKNKKYMFAVTSQCEQDEIKHKLLLLCKNKSIDNYLVLNGSKNENGSIIIYENSKQDPFTNKCNVDPFKDICKKHPEKVIFLIKIKEESLILSQIYDPKFYLKRQIDHIEEVEVEGKEIVDTIRNNTKSCFVISNTSSKTVLENDCTSEEMTKWIENKNIILAPTYDKSSFYDLAKEFTHVHWLKIKENIFIWKQSHGSLEVIRKSKKNVKSYEEERLCNSVNKSFVIMSDAAGMGKTTTLTKIIQHLRSKSNWVIDINFREKSVQNNLKILSDNITMTEESVINFICNIDYLHLDNCTAKCLLQNYFVNNKKLAFVLDGFDEIPQILHKVTMDLLKFIKEKPTCFIYLTTREHCAAFLEDHFSVLSLKFKEITDANREECIVNFWHNRLILTQRKTTEELALIAKNVMNKINYITDIQLNIARNPMHIGLISEIMILKILQNKVEEFLINDFSIITLYKLFITIKFETTYIKKIKYMWAKSPEFEILKDYFDKIHSKLAFKFLFPSLMDKNVKDTFSNHVDEIMLIGLLNLSPVDGEIEFIHRTFCEYFCARFIVNCLQNKQNISRYYQMSKSVVTNELFLKESNDSCFMLRLFVNYMLAESLPIHKAILKNDRNVFHELIEKNDESINKKDAFGKSVLHYAAQYGDAETIFALLNSQLDIDSFMKTSDLSGRTPLHYASQFRHDNIEYLIQPFIENSVFFKKNVSHQLIPLNNIMNIKDNIEKSCLYYLAEACDWLLLMKMIDHGVNLRSVMHIQKERIIQKLLNYLQFNINNSSDKLIFLTHLLLDDNVLSKEVEMRIFSIMYLNENHFTHDTLLFKIVSKKHKFEKKDYDYLTNCFTDKDLLVILKSIVKGDIFVFEKQHMLRILNTFINCSAKYGFPNTLKYAIRLVNTKYKGFYVKENQYTDTINSRALHFAALHGNLSVVKQLCNDGEDIDAVNIKGQTALHYACMTSKLDTIKYLVSKRSNVNAVDHLKQSVLDQSLRYKPNHIEETIQCAKYLILECNAYSEKIEDFRTQVGNDNIIDRLFNATAKTVNIPINGTTLLHKAAEANIELFVRYLLYLGADTKAKDSNGQTPFQCIEGPESESYCILSQHERRLNLSLKEKLKDYLDCKPKSSTFSSRSTPTSIIVPINIRFIPSHIITFIKHSLDNNGKSLLHLLSEDGKTFILDDLIFHDDVTFHYEGDVPLNFSIQDDNGDTPLHVAVRSGHVDIVVKLLANGAIFNICNNDRRTPIQCSNNKLQTYEEITCIFNETEYFYNLVKHNQYESDLGQRGKYGLVNMKGENGLTPLHWAIRNENIKTVKLLLTFHAKIDSKDSSQKTPLHYIAKNKNTDCLIELLSNGAIYDARDKDTLTPYELCEDGPLKEYFYNVIQVFKIIKSQDENETLTFVKKFSDDRNFVKCVVNTCDYKGNTLLHYAAYKAYLEIVYFVLTNGGNLKKNNKNRKTPIDMTSNLNIHNLLFVSVLLFRLDKDKFYPIPNLLLICEKHELLKQVIINYRDLNNTTLLHGINDLRFVNWLIKNAANNVNDIQLALGYTALFFAVDNRNIFLVDIICKGGGDVNIQDYSGHTALHVAVASRRFDIVKYLVRAGANPMLKNKDDKMPIDLVDKRDDHIITYLRNLDIRTEIK